MCDLALARNYNIDFIVEYDFYVTMMDSKFMGMIAVVFEFEKGNERTYIRSLNACAKRKAKVKNDKNESLER